MQPCAYCGEPTPWTTFEDHPLACHRCQGLYHQAAQLARRTRGGYGYADEHEVLTFAWRAVEIMGRAHQHRPYCPVDHPYALGYIPCGRCGTFTLDNDLDDEHTHYVAGRINNTGAYLCTTTGHVTGHDAIVAFDAAYRARHPEWYS